MSLFDKLMDIKNRRGAGFLVLIDPDENDPGDLTEFARQAESSGVDAFMVGASMLLSDKFEQTIKTLKNNSNLPVLIFPGSSNQISDQADGILFLTMVSSRNPQYLISEQVKGAPLVKSAGLEVIPIGYILIESGRMTSVQYVSNSLPIPSDKPDLVKAHALAAQYMGMQAVYLEAGSGALYSVPEELINAVRDYADIQIIVGGGIRTPQDAREKVLAGASFVVIGNFFQKDDNTILLEEFAQAVHTAEKSEVKIER